MDETTTPTPAPEQVLSEEAAALHAQFKAIDPKRNGAGLNTIAMFYPKTGWNVIRGYVRELETAGMLTSRNVLNRKGGVSHKLYTWQSA